MIAHLQGWFITSQHRLCLLHQRSPPADNVIQFAHQLSIAEQTSVVAWGRQFEAFIDVANGCAFQVEPDFPHDPHLCRQITVVIILHAGRALDLSRMP